MRCTITHLALSQPPRKKSVCVGMGSKKKDFRYLRVDHNRILSIQKTRERVIHVYSFHLCDCTSLFPAERVSLCTIPLKKKAGGLPDAEIVVKRG